MSQSRPDLSAPLSEAENFALGAIRELGLSPREVLAAVAEFADRHPRPAPPADREPEPEAPDDEGRRLVRAYYLAVDALTTAAVESDAAYVAVIDRRKELTAFVVRASGREPLSGPPSDTPQIALDTEPAAVVRLDGQLWVALQDPDGEPGDVLLTHVPAGGIADLDPPAPRPSAGPAWLDWSELRPRGRRAAALALDHAAEAYDGAYERFKAISAAANADDDADDPAAVGLQLAAWRHRAQAAAYLVRVAIIADGQATDFQTIDAPGFRWSPLAVKAGRFLVLAQPSVDDDGLTHYEPMTADVIAYSLDHGHLIDLDREPEVEPSRN